MTCQPSDVLSTRTNSSNHKNHPMKSVSINKQHYTLETSVDKSSQNGTRRIIIRCVTSVAGQLHLNLACIKFVNIQVETGYVVLRAIVGQGCNEQQMLLSWHSHGCMRKTATNVSARSIKNKKRI